MKHWFKASVIGSLDIVTYVVYMSRHEKYMSQAQQFLRVSHANQ